MRSACAGVKVLVKLIIKAKMTLSSLSWKEVPGEGDIGKKLGSCGHSGTGKGGGTGCVVRTGAFQRSLPLGDLPVVRLCSQWFSTSAHCNNSYYLLGAYSSTDASGASCD